MAGLTNRRCEINGRVTAPGNHSDKEWPPDVPNSIDRFGYHHHQNKNRSGTENGNPEVKGPAPPKGHSTAPKTNNQTK